MNPRSSEFAALTLARIAFPTGFGLSLQWELRIEAPPAPRLVHAYGAYDEQILRRYQPLRMDGRVAAAHADGQQFRDLFGYGEQPRHGLEGTTQEVRVQASHNDALA